MINRILLPTDFSKHSRKCIDYILKLKDCGINEVIIMHVIDYKIIKETDIIFDGEVDEETIIERSIEQAEKQLKIFTEPLENNGLRISFLVKVGNPCSEIIKAADEMNVSMIIMGHRGHNLAEELLLGSNSEKVIRKSSKPVLLIK